MVGRHLPQLSAAEIATFSPRETYLWYDLETFGRLPRRDQVAQFAGIRTDGNLRLVALPTSVLCQPIADTLPSPGACLVHGITAQNCARSGLPEWLFAGLVAAALDTPGTTAIGYNNISFDAAFTEALRWRNLLPAPPDGATQLDLLDILVAVRCFDPDALRWPLRPDGTVSLRLVDVCVANGVDASDAHDALADVAGTLGLAQLAQRANPGLWSALVSRRQPAAVAATLAVAADAGQWLVRVSPWADRSAGSAQVMLQIAAATTGCRVALLDLAVPVEEVQAWLAGGEARSPLAIVDICRSPMLFRADHETLQWLRRTWGHDLTQFEEATTRTQHLLPALVGAAQARLEVRRRESSGQAQPDPFDPGPPQVVSATDAALLTHWRDLAGQAQAGVGLPRLPADPRLRRVVELFRARHLSQTLPPTSAAQWDSLRAARIAEMAEQYGYAHLAGGAGGADRSLIDEVLAHARALGWQPPAEGAVPT